MVVCDFEINGKKIELCGKGGCCRRLQGEEGTGPAGGGADGPRKPVRSWRRPGAAGLFRGALGTDTPQKMTRGVFAGQQGLGFSFQGHINRKSISSHRRSCPRRVSHLGPSTRPLGGPCGSWSPGPRPAGPVRTASGWAVRLWGEVSHRHCVAL